MTAYSWAGCIIESEIFLPELRCAPPTSAVDARVIVGAVPTENGAAPIGCVWQGEGRCLVTTPAARFLVEDGHTITVDPVLPLREERIRLFLLGSAFAVLAGQRGIHLLHAAATHTGRGAIAFTAPSGHGKSSMVAGLSTRGQGVLADDVLPLVPREGLPPLALAAVRRLRLFPDVVSLAGRSSADHPPTLKENAKLGLFPPDDPAMPVEMPLLSLYLLEQAAPDAMPTLEPITGLAALEAIRTATYRPHYAVRAGRHMSHLAACTRIAATVPVFRLSRPWNLARVDETIALVEEHQRSLERTIVSEPN